MPVLIGSALIALAILLAGRRVAVAIPASAATADQGPNDLYHVGMSCGECAPGALSRASGDGSDVNLEALPGGKVTAPAPKPVVRKPVAAPKRKPAPRGKLLAPYYKFGSG